MNKYIFKYIFLFVEKTGLRTLGGHHARQEGKIMFAYDVLLKSTYINQETCE